jgi:hypothetical protein
LRRLLPTRVFLLRRLVERVEELVALGYGYLQSLIRFLTRLSLSDEPPSTPVRHNASIVLSSTMTRYEPPHPLFGCQLKLDRAYEHIEALNSAIQGFLGRRPYELWRRFDPQISEYFVYLRVRDTPPIKWSIIIGEIVHNLRSALDHLAWQLVKANGNKPDRATGFPIFSDNPFADNASEKSLERWEKMTAGMHTDDIAILKELQPYNRGNRNSSLFILNSLSNHDKHREIHFTQNVVTNMKVEFTNQRDCELEPLVDPYRGTFENGTVVLHYRVIPTGDNPHVHVEAECTFNIAFRYPGTIVGLSVEETLILLGNVVHDITHMFGEKRFSQA